MLEDRDLAKFDYISFMEKMIEDFTMKQNLVIELLEEHVTAVNQFKLRVDGRIKELEDTLFSFIQVQKDLVNQGVSTLSEESIVQGSFHFPAGGA